MNKYRAETELEYSVVNDSIIQIGTGKQAISIYYAGILTIPNKIDNKVVTRLNDYAFLDCNITSIKLPDTIAYIGKECFKNCKIESFTCPKSVTFVGESAFRASKVNFANFKNTNMKQFNGGSHFNSCPLMKNILLPDTLTDVPTHFLYGTPIENFTITKSVKAIQAAALAACQYLKTFYSESPHYFIHQGIVYSSDLRKLIAYPSNTDVKILPTVVIFDSARSFSGSSLARIKIKNAVEFINAHSFRDMKNVVTVDISRTKAIVIPAWTFNNCPKLIEVLLPPTLTKIMNGVFGRCPLKVMTLPDKLMNADKAFDGCSIKEIHYCGTNAVTGFLPQTTIVHVTNDYKFNSFMNISTLDRNAKCFSIEKDMQDLEEFIESKFYRLSPKVIKKMSSLLRTILKEYGKGIREEFFDDI